MGFDRVRHSTNMLPTLEHGDRVRCFHKHTAPLESQRTRGSVLPDRELEFGDGEDGGFVGR
jgi:hypothetical protein